MKSRLARGCEIEDNELPIRAATNKEMVAPLRQVFRRTEGPVRAIPTKTWGTTGEPRLNRPVAGLSLHYIAAGQVMVREESQCICGSNGNHLCDGLGTEHSPAIQAIQF